ncbi:hypothetical protein Pint_06224 [Pistacia integerrima]|uniref:Uncharacterized protein n=1 Tax=Pistacia integerrima TaxID=434235 RepID=A0ACC0Z1V0_9ROSI|nr:hypothetical protein Pint_06224 [Pistacia integerrima]
MARDDLSVTPASKICGIDFLQQNVRDTSALEKELLNLALTREGVHLWLLYIVFELCLVLGNNGSGAVEHFIDTGCSSHFCFPPYFF